MKIPREHLDGLYLHYTDLAEPVIDLRSHDSVKYTYAFTRHNDRTDLVKDFDHVSELLKSGRFEVVGAEVSLSEEQVTLDHRGAGWQTR